VTDFVTSEEKRIKLEAQAAAESARSRRRHLIDSARSLIMLLESAGKPIPDAGFRAIPGAALQADDQRFAAMQALVSREIQQETSRGSGGVLSAER